ncbi:hypothetical protein F5Y16DRAFT_409472 [Xylariaceae sp. FL0255]|nr:hypothetical protein F5Y16DRAFT_409472 [Xylariaceae sp. FL0255]
MTSTLLKGAVLAFLATVPAANAHTWVEAMYQIDATGAYIGNATWPIGYLARAASVSDFQHENKILDTSTNPTICKPLSSSNTDLYPYPTLGAGDYLAMQYQENGHVSQPTLTKRPYRGGNVYVYGSSEADSDTVGINDALAWTYDGTGGNKKGKLIASHYFDDGQCFQANPNAAIAVQRAAATKLSSLNCQTDVKLPDDLPSSGTYTLYWVWDWPLIVTDTQNTTEIYTTCAQIQLTDSSNNTSSEKIEFAANNLLQSAAVSTQLATLIEATALGIGQSSPAPVTLTGTSGASATCPAPAVVTTTATSNSGSTPGGNVEIQTVTVTGAPETVTAYTTVTAGVSPTETATSSDTSATATGPPAVSPFLKRASARVTGSARRSRHHPAGLGVNHFHP